MVVMNLDRGNNAGNLPGLRPCGGLPELSLKEKVERYGGAAPRYTSYPTANHFKETDDPEAILRGLRENEETTRRALGLYVHLPYCRERCWYCGCNMLPAVGRAKVDEYLDCVEREMELVQSLAPVNRPWTAMHWGGGTPNLLTPDQITGLRKRIDRHHEAAPEARFSVELDPRTLDAEKVEAFARAGCNRVSLGVQDTTPEVQKAVHRVQPHEWNVRAANLLRVAGIEALNVDLIYGFPLQTEGTMVGAVEAILELRPTRVALFGYAHIPRRLPAQKLLERSGPLPDSMQRLRLFSAAANRLSRAGYVQVGLDHFARPEDPLVAKLKNGNLRRNFQGYTEDPLEDLRGYGISALSETEGRYFQNHRDLAAYRAALTEDRPAWARDCVLTAEDRERRAVIMGVMTRLGFDPEVLISEGVEHPEAYLAEARTALEQMHEDGLLVLTRSGFQVTPEGRYFLRSIAAVFDRGLSSAKAHVRAV